MLKNSLSFIFIPQKLMLLKAKYKFSSFTRQDLTLFLSSVALNAGFPKWEEMDQHPGFQTIHISYLCYFFMWSYVKSIVYIRNSGFQTF